MLGIDSRLGDARRGSSEELMRGKPGCVLRDCGIAGLRDCGEPGVREMGAAVTGAEGKRWDYAIEKRGSVPAKIGR